MATTSNVQIYCQTLQAFIEQTGDECYYVNETKESPEGAIMGYIYEVTFSALSKHPNHIPVLMRVRVGRVMPYETVMIRQVEANRQAIIDYVISTATDKTFTDNTMITTGEGFSTTETQMKIVIE